jgi:cell division protein FtsA
MKTKAVMTKSGLAMALDIGTTKIVCLVGRMHSQGECDIISAAMIRSEGYRGGVVTESSRLTQAVMSVVTEAERIANETVERVWVSITGNRLTSHCMAESLTLPSGQVEPEDVSVLIGKLLDRFDPDTHEIIYYTPLQFCLDEVSGIQEPSGLFGARLECQLHTITAAPAGVMNLANCMAQCHLDVQDFVVSGYASGLSCLTPDEMELGVTVIDVGGSATHLASFKNGKLCHIATVPLGGMHITSDVAQGLVLSLQQAEQLKLAYGHTQVNPSDAQAVLDIGFIDHEDTPAASQPVTRAALRTIIRARAQEILEMSKAQLDRSGMGSLVQKRIVLVGGSSQLAGLRELAAEVFGTSVRVGTPRLGPKMTDRLQEPFPLNRPDFATVMGMMQFILDTSIQARYDMGRNESKPPQLLARISQWIQDNF